MEAWSRLSCLLLRVFFLFGLVIVLHGFLPATQHTVLKAQDFSIEQVLHSIHVAYSQPKQLQFKQTADVRGVLGNYHWVALITRDGASTNVQANGVPTFFSSDILADLADIEKAMDNFSLEYKGMAQENGRSYLLVAGTRKVGITSGAISGQMWVDPKSFLVQRTEARYEWGKINVQQTYTFLDGIPVLTKQEGSISPLAMRLTITYTDYKLGH